MRQMELFFPSVPWSLLRLSPRLINWRYWGDERSLMARLRQLHLEIAERR